MESSFDIVILIKCECILKLFSIKHPNKVVPEV